MSDGPYRVRYAEGQRLRAEDLRSEQEYLIAFDQRHNLAQHAPGIVSGLDLHRDWRDLPALRAGTAVDDDGGLLVLDQSSATDQEVEGCLDAWLIRCEAPFRLRHPGRATCGFDRVREQVRVVTVRVSAEDDPVPPVAGAAYLGRSVCADRRDRTYTFITAAEVRDPARRASMQVGPLTGRDRNGFTLSTIDAASVLTPRITLDRLGTNRFHGNVTLAGYRAWAAVALTETQLLSIRARRPGIGGEQIHVRMRPDLSDPNKPQLRLQFFDGARKSPPDLLLPKQGLEKVVEEFQSELVTVKLVKAPNRRPFKRRPISDDVNLPKGEDDEQEPVPDAFDRSADVTLKTRGGTLDLGAWPATAASEPVRVRGCYQRTTGDESIGKGVNGLKFIALKKAPEAPPVPGAWSVETGTPAAPTQEMRLDLGAKKDGDVSVRFSVGNVKAEDNTYADWLNINGSSLASMPHVKVDGTIEFAPIKPDHTDPNFTNLLVRAWMDGLQAAIEASTVVDVTFTGLPTLIKTGETWNYSIAVNNASEKEITADRILETRTITGLPAPLSRVISQEISIPAKSSKSIPIAHPADDTPAGLMSIEMRVSGKIGNAAWWRARKTDVDIPVVESPSIDVAGIPDSVPKTLPWTYSFDVHNNALAPVTLQAVTVQEGANAPQPLPGTPVNLPAQTSKTFTPAQHAGMNNNLQLTVTADFLWPADNSTTSVNQHRTVVAKRDLSASVGDAEPAENVVWTYKLALTNSSTRALTLQSITQRIVSVQNDFPPTQLQPVDIQPNLVIDASDVLELEIEGPDVPSATQQISLELDVEYRRNDDGRTFTIHHTKELNVS